MLLRGGIWPLPCAHLIPTTPLSPNSSTSPCTIGGLLFKNVGNRNRLFKHDRTYGARNSIVKAVCSSVRCPYQILGLDTKASEKEIKRAYRGLALKFHPDVNKEPDAQEKFMQIKQAYQTLIDPKKRAKYDLKRQANESWSGKSRYREEEFYGLEDFFRDSQEEFRASKGRPKSLWEELAELGEEFVEFLEKELNIEPDKDDDRVEQEEDKPFGKDKEARKATDANVDDIEEMLNQLKKELGL